MDILTQTISLLFRHRQTEIGRFGQDIDHIQRKQLHALLSTARKTEWGLKYDYKSIRSYSDFCQRLPLQTYDEIKPYVTRMINGERNILWPSVVRWYAKSSGTTNDKSKFLPVTPEILKGCHYKGGFDCVAIYLRNNPGGEVTTVVSMADYILKDGGRILTVANKKGTEETYDAEDGHSLEIPMVVLVNGNSASASEVFTGAMKDYGVATIVGTKTFGKGIVQTLMPLSDGSAIKLTTDHYYTPNGNDIHGKGIEPDLEVELDEEAAQEVVIPEEKDNQLQKAVEVVKGK